MPPVRRAPAKPKHAGKTIARVFSYLAKHLWLFMLVLVSILLSSALQVYASSRLQPAIDTISALAQGAPGVTMGNLIFVLVTMATAYGVTVILNYAYARIMVFVSTDTLFRIRSDLFSKMEKLPIPFFDRHTHGELMSLFTNDVDALREMISNSVANLLSSMVTVIGYFVAMVITNWMLTLVVLAMLVVITFTVKTIGGKSAKYFIRQQAELGKVNGYVEEFIEGQKVVKVFCREEKAQEGFEEKSGELCHAATNAHTFANILMPVMNNISHIAYAVVAIVGAAIAIHDPAALSVGAFVVFLTYTRQFTRPFGMMSQQVNSILTALAGAERIFAVIDETPEQDEGYVTLVCARENEAGEPEETEERTGKWAWKHPHHDGTTTLTWVKGKVEMEDVTFGYVPEKTVLHHISLYAKPGQKIAFVGSTGAGKTTITNLINRFYDVPDGKIRYDGININKIKKPDLRRSMAMVLQDSHLFSGTVLDNIRYGRLDATDEECIAAAKLANADFFIRHLPDGYNTFLEGDGSNLSQGQVQLLTIARAAVADPPVLILDEATSSIDTRTESLIEKGMDSLMAGRTVFVIAHRLSTVRRSNAIMVLENGEIIERGDHDQLLAMKGKYYQLYTGAFELS
ncbi:MAG: ABC transporter ATP-binding protein [Clostridia bacterium]|nr:ABC transporter ATP-binding protein [Clostridia bacterium]